MCCDMWQGHVVLNYSHHVANGDQLLIYYFILFFFLLELFYTLLKLNNSVMRSC